MTSNPRRFYVYAYLRGSDSCNGKKYSPYYIGKGSGYRMFSKQKRTCPVPKDRALIVFVQEGLTENEAFALEKYCIKTYGRLDQGTGILRHRCDGGEGLSGAIVSLERRIKMSKVSSEARTREGRWQGNKNPNAGGDAVRGSKNPMWGKMHSEETKAKISAAITAHLSTPMGQIQSKLRGQKYLYELLDPMGEVYITENLLEFAKQYGLSNCSLNRVVHGKAKQHKGWTGKILKKTK